MKSKIVTLALLIVMLCLTGCGSEEQVYCGVNNTYDIQISDNEYVTISVPVEAILTLTDNCSHYEFSDGTIIDLANSQVTTAKYNEETGLYVSKNAVQLNVDNKCIVASCSGTMNEQMQVLLQNVTRTKVTTDLYKELRRKTLPTYEPVEMELRGNMYLPLNTPERNWLSLESQLYTEGTEYLQLTIFDYPFADIKLKLITQALCNTGKAQVDEWYQDDEITYIKVDNHYIVTKRLAYNCTYVYSCSEGMLNYALQGASKTYGVVGSTVNKEGK